MRNCPAWIVAYMAVLKAGGDRHPRQRLVAGRRAAPRPRLTEPKLVIADAPRAKRLEATGSASRRRRAAGREADRRGAGAAARRGGEADLPEVLPEDDATILFTSGSTGLAKGALSTHRAVTTGIYAYSISLIACSESWRARAGRRPIPPRTLVNVPLFHVTGEVPVLLNSFVIGRAWC
jgi:long-chain acyl-CoA synthetase